MFKDKVVVVTGCAQGIGKCCAECFAREGDIVHMVNIQQGGVVRWGPESHGSRSEQF